jgi:antitoxin ParD1/3/4
MIRKTISMPDEMGSWIQDRIKRGQFNNESEYFRDLVRRDQEKRQAMDQLRTMLDEAEASGISDRTARAIWDEVEQRHAAESD